MAKRKNTAAVSTQFNEVQPAYEDETLEIYALLTETSEDFHLKSLPKLFKKLKIPSCFTRDIKDATEFFYDIQGLLMKTRTAKTEIVLNYITTFSIISQPKSDEGIIDIVDVDKLLKYTSKLLFYRDNFEFIKETWKLFVNDSSSSTDFKLTLPDLKAIKVKLNLDGPNAKQQLDDLLLIDMLSCCTSDDYGTVHNFTFGKHSGLYIDIKDFACILGNLGEFDR